MYKLPIDLAFDKTILARSKVFNNIKYGAQIDVSNNANYLIVCDGLKRINGEQINDDPSLFKRTDKKSHKVTLISPAIQSGEIGGNVLTPVEALNGYVGHFYYPCKYLFQVEEGVLFLKSFTETENKITKTSAVSTINTFIANAVKETIASYINENGETGYSEHLVEINNDIKDKVADDLRNVGIKLNVIDLHLSQLDEDEVNLSNNKKLKDQAVKEESKCLD